MIEEKKGLCDQNGVSCLCIQGLRDAARRNFNQYNIFVPHYASLRLLKEFLYTHSHVHYTWQHPIATCALMKHFSQAINFRYLMSEFYTERFVYPADSDVFVTGYVRE